MTFNGKQFVSITKTLLMFFREVTDGRNATFDVDVFLVNIYHCA